jgi:hypothetical protein
MSDPKSTQEVIERHIGGLEIKLGGLMTLAEQRYGELDADTMAICVEALAKDCLASASEFRIRMRFFAKKTEVAHES